MGENDKSVNEEKINNLEKEKERIEKQLETHNEKVEKYFERLSNSIDNLSKEIYKLNSHYVTRQEYQKDINQISDQLAKLYKRHYTWGTSIIVMLLSALATILWDMLNK